MFRNVPYQPPVSFIKTNPTKEDIADFICQMANRHGLNVNETYAWKLAQKFKLTIEDFHNNQGSWKYISPLKVVNSGTGYYVGRTFSDNTEYLRLTANFKYKRDAERVFKRLSK